MDLRLQPVFFGLRVIPESVHSHLLAALVTRFMRGQAIERRLSVLNGKRIDIGISDVPCTLKLSVRDAALRAAGPGRSDWDVRIVGTLADYWKLATRAEDPDTLFFARRLCLEGDTETALYIKNLLDAFEFDWEAHIVSVFGERAGGLAASLARSFVAINARRPREPN